MAAQRSVGRFCSTVTNDLTSLAALDAVNLGIGAQVYVLSVQKHYRLLSSSFGTLSPVTIRATDATGTWFQEDAVNDQTLLIYAVFASSSVSVIQNFWSALPTAVNEYAVSVSKACWSMNANTGIVTYNGPVPARFSVRANFSFTTNAESFDSWEFDLARNGDLVGVTTTLATSTAISDLTGEFYATHLSPPITITPTGTSYQHVFRNVNENASISLTRYQAIFQLLP